jgi:hypothetical protein
VARRLGEVNFTEDTHRRDTENTEFGESFRSGLVIRRQTPHLRSHNPIFHSKGLKGHEEQTFEQEEREASTTRLSSPNVLSSAEGNGGVADLLLGTASSRQPPLPLLPHVQKSVFVAFVIFAV